MSFLHPEFLYYMLPLIFILFGLLLTQKEAHASFFSDEVMQKLRVSSNTLTLKARNALFFLIAVLMTIALAGPVIKDGKIEVTAKSADIMIALDISDSMLAEDVYPNRLQLAKQKALELLRLAPNERIGVIAFAKNSYLVSPLSFDHEAVAFLLKKLDTNSITEQGTDFMAMLEVVDKSIKKDAKKYLLVLTDGGDKKDFAKEIAFAKEKGITIFVLGIGTPQGAPIKLENGEFIKQNGKIIVSKLNEKIADLAKKTGGVYIESVNSNADVKAMLKEIEQNSKKKELKSEQIEKYIPLFYYPLGLALLLFLIATSSMSKRVKVEVPALLALLLFSSTPSQAGLLDFIELDEAKKAYEQKNYLKSAKIYSEYAKHANHNESYYNAANALYKAGKYKEAIKNYEKATFDDKVLRAKNFANMGNAYAKLGDEASLQKAIESYEESLKLYEDKDTRDNLEAVKKALKQKKEKQEQQNKKRDRDQKKDRNNKKEQQNQQKDQQNKKEQQNKQEQKDTKGSKEKEQRKSQKPSEEEKKRQEENSKQKQNEQQKRETGKKQKKEEKKQEKRMKKQDKKDEKQKQEEQKKKTATAQSDKSMKMQNRMSDAEEAKWLKRLNSEQNTYLYRLNQSRKIKEKSDEKPW